MSSSTYQNKVNSLSKEIQRLEAKRADFSKQIAAKKKSASALSSSLKNAKGSSLTSKLNQINKLENDAANLEGKRAEVEKQISRKQVDLNNANTNGAKNIDRMNNMPVTIAVKPVLPPFPIPVALSTNDVTVLVPNTAPTIPPSASAKNAFSIPTA